MQGIAGHRLPNAIVSSGEAEESSLTSLHFPTAAIISTLSFPSSPPSSPSCSFLSRLGHLLAPGPISLETVGAAAESGRVEGGGSAVYRRWSGSIHQLCSDLETKHNKYLALPQPCFP